MTLGYRIKEARKDAKLTQSQLAEKCGVATITIRQYESEKREPRLDTLRDIATALGVSIGYLQGYESKDAAKIVEALKKSDMRTVEDLMGLPEGSILSPNEKENLLAKQNESKSYPDLTGQKMTFQPFSTTELELLTRGGSRALFEFYNLTEESQQKAAEEIEMFLGYVIEKYKKKQASDPSEPNDPSDKD